MENMTATEMWNYFVSIRGYKEPTGDLEDDGFFDDEKICRRYGDWDSENGCRKYNITNAELRTMLNTEDTEEYIKYMQCFIDELEES